MDTEGLGGVKASSTLSTRQHVFASLNNCSRSRSAQALIADMPIELRQRSKTQSTNLIGARVGASIISTSARLPRAGRAWPWGSRGWGGTTANMQGILATMRVLLATGVTAKGLLLHGVSAVEVLRQTLSVAALLRA